MQLVEPFLNQAYWLESSFFISSDTIEDDDNFRVWRLLLPLKHSSLTIGHRRIHLFLEAGFSCAVFPAIHRGKALDEFGAVGHDSPAKHVNAAGKNDSAM